MFIFLTLVSSTEEGHICRPSFVGWFSLISTSCFLYRWRVLDEPRSDSWLRKPPAWGDTSHEAPCTGRVVSTNNSPMVVVGENDIFPGWGIMKKVMTCRESQLQEVRREQTGFFFGDFFERKTRGVLGEEGHSVPTVRFSWVWVIV